MLCNADPTQHLEGTAFYRTAYRVVVDLEPTMMSAQTAGKENLIRSTRAELPNHNITDSTFLSYPSTLDDSTERYATPINPRSLG